MTPTLETVRLSLRPIELADADQIQVIFPQWEIVKYLANKIPWPYPPDGARTFLRDIALPTIERGDEWIWTIRRKEDPGTIIGSISLEKNENENRGFWIAPEWRNRGLMTEACDAVTDYWFERLQFPVLRAPKAIVNEGSRRISEKQGMRIVATEDRDYVSGRLPSEIWEITAEEWRARKRSDS
ncbi:MAG: GNAT family N-acetyltransferase [Acidobacteria bacterium]|nr:GNAT family N-acetyltransferase [Acidobacteriota bacterium]